MNRNPQKAPLPAVVRDRDDPSGKDTPFRRGPSTWTILLLVAVAFLVGIAVGWFSKLHSTLPASRAVANRSLLDQTNPSSISDSLSTSTVQLPAAPGPAPSPQSSSSSSALRLRTSSLMDSSPSPTPSPSAAPAPALGSSLVQPYGPAPSGSSRLPSNTLGGGIERTPTKFVAPSPSTSGQPRLRLLTYATHAGGDFCKLLLSAAYNDLSTLVLGFNPDPHDFTKPDTQNANKGLGYKFVATQEVLKGYDDNDIILFVDAFDSIITNSYQHILEEFLDMNHPILFQAEKGCWPYLENLDPGTFKCLNLYPPSPTMYRFINSGQWLGRVKPARKLLDDMLQGRLKSEVGNMNDQGLVTDFFVCDSLNVRLVEARDQLVETMKPYSLEDAFKLIQSFKCEMSGKRQNPIFLDYHCRIFQSLHNSEVDQRIYAAQDMGVHVRFSDRGWLNFNTNSYPSVFHGNGGGKAHMPKIYELALRDSEKMNRVKQNMDEWVTFQDRPEFNFRKVCGGM